MEQDLVAAAGQDDLDRVVDVGQDPGQLVERPGRDDDARLRDGVEDRDGLDRDPVVVGGGEGQLVALEPGQDAGQDRPGLVAGRRERGLGEGPAQDVLGDPRGRPLAGRVRMAGNSSASMPLMWVSNRPQRRWSVVARPELEVDPVAGRQRVDEVGQQLGRDGRRAVGLDLARDPVGDPDLEVGRGQLEPGVLGLEQDVGQDRQGAPVGHGATDDRQAARQVLLHDREFHVGLTPRCRGRAADAARVGGAGRRRSVAPRSRDRAVGSWVSSLYLLTPSSPSSWCGHGGRSRSAPFADAGGRAGRRRWTGGSASGSRRRTAVDDPAEPPTPPTASGSVHADVDRRPRRTAADVHIGQGFPPNSARLSTAMRPDGPSRAAGRTPRGRPGGAAQSA